MKGGALECNNPGPCEGCAAYDEASAILADDVPDDLGASNRLYAQAQRMALDFAIESVWHWIREKHIQPPLYWDLITVLEAERAFQHEQSLPKE